MMALVQNIKITSVKYPVYVEATTYHEDILLIPLRHNVFS